MIYPVQGIVTLRACKVDVIACNCGIRNVFILMSAWHDDRSCFLDQGAKSQSMMHSHTFLCHMNITEYQLPHSAIIFTHSQLVGARWGHGTPHADVYIFFFFFFLVLHNIKLMCCNLIGWYQCHKIVTTLPYLWEQTMCIKASVTRLVQLSKNPNRPFIMIVNSYSKLMASLTQGLTT